MIIYLIVTLWFTDMKDSAPVVEKSETLYTREKFCAAWSGAKMNFDSFGFERNYGYELNVNTGKSRRIECVVAPTAIIEVKP